MMFQNQQSLNVSFKAGVLNCERETNAAEAADSDFDPFAELDSDINIVQDLAKETWPGLKKR